jgi:hypothetical protein
MLAMAGARPFGCLGALILGQVVDGLRWQNRHGSNIGEYTQHIVEHIQHCSICVQENGYRVLKKTTECNAHSGLLQPSFSFWYQFWKQCQQFQVGEQGLQLGAKQSEGFCKTKNICSKLDLKNACGQNLF